MSSNLAVKEINYDDLQYQEMGLDNLYNFSLFEPLEEKVIEEKKEKIKIKKESKEARENSLKYILNLIKIFVSFGIVASLTLSMIGLNALCDEKAGEIMKIESQIEIAKSEKVRLESALSTKTSIAGIKDYAENQLGMVKLENYKITYLPSNEENCVVVSGGKSYDDTIFDRIKKIFVI